MKFSLFTSNGFCIVGATLQPDVPVQPPVLPAPQPTAPHPVAAPAADNIAAEEIIFLRPDLPQGPNDPLYLSVHDDPDLSPSLAPGEKLPRRPKTRGSIAGHQPARNAISVRRQTTRKKTHKESDYPTLISDYVALHEADPATYPRPVVLEESWPKYSIAATTDVVLPATHYAELDDSGITYYYQADPVPPFMLGVDDITPDVIATAYQIPGTYCFLVLKQLV